MAKESTKKSQEKKTHEKKTPTTAQQGKEREPKAAAKGGKSGAAKYVVGAVIIVIIIGAAIFAGSMFNESSSTNFNTFRSNFLSAPRVAIIVTAYNGTILSGTVGCATAIIEEIAGSKVDHRNTSTVDFGIINSTTCIQEKGLEVGSGNYITTSVQNCLNLTNTEPTVYINYSTTGNSTIIKPKYLYISGTYAFLRECGVASEIS